MKALLEKIRKILRSRRTRQLLTRTVSGIAAIVVFVTTYALVLPAITMEQEARCGITAHEHTDVCYEERLVCQIPEDKNHHHDASCYEKFLICGQQVHVHSTECYQQYTSAVVSSGSTTAASTDLGALVESELYSRDDSGDDAGSILTDSGSNALETVEEDSSVSVEVSDLAADTNPESEGTDPEASGNGISENTDSVTTNPADAESQSFEGNKITASEENESVASEEKTGNRTEGLNGETGGLDSEEGDSQGASDGSVPFSDTSDPTAADTPDADLEFDNSTADRSDENLEASDSTADRSDENLEASDSAAGTSDENLEVSEAAAGTSDENDDFIDVTAGTSDVNPGDSDTVSDTSGMAGAETQDAETAGTEAAAQEAANDATTKVLPESVENEKIASGYVPGLDTIEFCNVLNKHTDFYYFHPEDGRETPAGSGEVTYWKQVKNGLFGSTKLKSTDLVRMYLSYTIPAGALNETNQAARYRLPSNIHLTDDQIIAINSSENGMSALYADAAAKEDGTNDEALSEQSEMNSDAEDVDTASGTDEANKAEAESDSREPDQDENAANYQKYLGAEAIEGSRMPDQKLKEGEQEYISAIVKAENVFDDEGLYGEKGAFLGQDLIFIFTPYSIEKNQTTYNADGDPLSAGEKITGWFVCDFNMNQIDWVKEDTDLDKSTVEKTAEVVFVEKDGEKNLKEISRTLKLVDGLEDQSNAAAGETSAMAETAAAAEIAGTAAAASETASSDEAKGAENGSFKSGTLTADGDGYRITLDYTEEAKIPENAELSVKEITAETDREAYEACLEQAGQQVAADDKTSVDQKASRFFDIEILVKEIVKDTGSDGEAETRKIEPSAPVSVNIQIIDDHTSKNSESGDEKTSQSDPSVLHFAEEGVEQIDATVKDIKDIKDIKDSREQESGEKKEAGKESESVEPAEPATEISFEAESFSIYGVVYTVDFHWEVNGKVYDFTIPGGGFVSFQHLVEALGIAGDTDYTNSTEADKTEKDNSAHTQNEAAVSDAVKEFTADVESVEFSSPDLVWVGKTKTAATVGQLKKANGLNCQYSAELQQEQIDRIDASTVEAGDWALISLRPFISAETLKVTMKDGEVFTVQVTDAQISTSFLSDKGTLYEVVVTYGEDAKIPENASLKVTPYKENSKEYDAVREIVYKDKKTEPAGVLQALDISIVDSNGQSIEPAAPVRVDLVMKNLAEKLEKDPDLFTVMHLNESSGSIQVENVADTVKIGNIHPEGASASATFTLDSFSQFAITYGDYVKVNVHYVDVNGTELRGSTSEVTAYNDTTVTMSDYQNRMNQAGYTYLGAHYGTYSGQVFTSLKATRNPTTGSLNNSGQSITFYNGSNIVARQEHEIDLKQTRQVDVYLVYAPSTGYYILDTIGEDGCLTVYNENGVVQTGKDKNLFVRWYRSNNNTTGFQEVTQSKILNGNYNIPELDGPKVNVSIDEGADQYYKAEIYTVENNQERVLATIDPYHVPYYDDVRNGGFETPHNDGNEGFNKWPSNQQVENGKNGIVWKTTGIANDGTKRDIEIPQGADAQGHGANNLGETLRNYSFAFMPEGNQCAELNCEASGALYQDVLTIPGTQLYWSLYHRARGEYDKWKNISDKTTNKETDTMYVVAMSKKLAEKYDVTTQEKVREIINHVNDQSSEFHDAEIVRITTTNQGYGKIEFLNSNITVKDVPSTYFGNLAAGQRATTYDGSTLLTYGNTDWHYYTGNFSIPSNQYLTRFFFVAGNTASHNPTMGNFLDDISMSDSVPIPNHGQATAIVKKTVTGLNALPEKYATRIETTYTVTEHNGVTTTVDKNSDYDHYRTEIKTDGSYVSTASWTFPIPIGNGESIVFTKGEETAPEDTTKTDVVEGYAQKTSYVISKQTSSQSSPQVVAQGDGKTIPSEEIERLTVQEKDIIYIEYINSYVPTKKVSVWKTDPDGNVIKTGAAFALYKAADYDDAAQKPKENAQVIKSDTTGSNGILFLGDLEVGEYRLVETDAPDGYNLLDSAIKIIVRADGVTAMQSNSNSQIAVKGDTNWVEGQADSTYQIRVWNNPGVELPSTGGPGTSMLYLLGTILTALAAAGVVMQRCKRAA